MGDILPEKHQRRWANNLLLDFDSINWTIIYKNNYYCTLETKLRSFRIKLNLQAVVCNSQYLDLARLKIICVHFAKKLLKLFCIFSVLSTRAKVLR